MSIKKTVFHSRGKASTRRGAGGVIRHARSALDLTQADFGAWLALKVGRNAPYAQSRVADWESGRKSPRLKIRLACREIAARSAAVEIISMPSNPGYCEEVARIIIDCQS